MKVEPPKQLKPRGASWRASSVGPPTYVRILLGAITRHESQDSALDRPQHPESCPARDAAQSSSPSPSSSSSSRVPSSLSRAPSHDSGRCSTGTQGALAQDATQSHGPGSWTASNVPSDNKHREERHGDQREGPSLALMSPPVIVRHSEVVN